MSEPSFFRGAPYPEVSRRGSRAPHRFPSGPLPFGRLNREEEAQLIRRAQAGDRKALERLIASVSGLVLRTASRFRCHSHALEDLYQEGVVGFMTAVGHFEPERGYRLSTYALYWIRQAIARAVAVNDRIIHLPGHAQTDLRLILRTRESWEAQHGRPPSDVELAGACGLTETRIRVLREAFQEVSSLDERVGRNADDSLLDLQEDHAVCDPARLLMLRAESDDLGMLIGKLPERERHVIRRRFGLDGRAVSTLDELSQELRVSRERVRQIEGIALERLRRALGAPVVAGRRSS